MKILHVEAGKHLYGGARQVLYIVEGLAARGVTNLLACPAGSEMARQQPAGTRVVAMKMGGDGHTASLFPASPNLRQGLAKVGERRCLPMLAPSVPHQRLSMTRALLASAGFTALSVQGAGKLATLRAALAGNDLTEMPIRAFLHDPLSIYWCP